MVENDLTTYDFWDLTQREIVPRSLLYSLEPMRVGTTQVESLTSYVSRLADAHQVTTGTLVVEKLAPLINQLSGRKNSNSRFAFSQVVERNSGALNGTGLMAQSLLGALSALTLRPELKFLTFLSWSNVLPDRGLLRPHAAWCPVCYEDWKEKQQQIYEPLLWKLKVITVCTYHQIFLSFKCPHCQQLLPQLQSCSLPGYCPKCYQWLGGNIGSHSSLQETLTLDDLSWQNFVTKNVGELLASAPSLSTLPCRADICTTINQCLEQSAGGNLQRFANYLCVSASSVWEWCQGNTIPQLLILLRICYCLGISLTDFLIVTDDLTTGKVTPLLNSQYSQTIQRFEIEQVQILLSAYLEKNPPESMEKIAQYLQQDKRDLYRHFPDICHEIAKRNQKYRSELSHQRIQKLCSQARSAAIELAALGVYPSDSRVQAHLNWKGHMKNQKIRDVLTLVRCELGFD